MNAGTALPLVLATGSFAVTVATVPLVKLAAARSGIVKRPGAGHPHLRSTPELGGPAIVGGWLIPLVAAGLFSAPVAIFALAMLGVGVIDDVVGLCARRKLVAQVIIAAGYAFTIRHLTLAPWSWLAAFATIFWLVATTNAFNLIDGLDGLAAGIGVIACGAIVAAGLLHHNLPVACSALTLGAALFGFLLYNFNPASIFMGDSGALTVGFILGALSLQVAGDAKNSAIAAYVFPLFLVMVPLLDTTVVTVTRLATGHPISARGLDHSHHRLLSLGLSHRSAVLFCWAVTLLTALYALATTLMPHPYLVATLPMICLALAPYALFLIDLSFENRTPGVTCAGAHGIARMALNLSYRMRVVDIALDAVLVAASYFAVSILWVNFRVTDEMVLHLLSGLPWVLVASCPAFFLVGVYRGMWRYVGFADVMRFGKGAVLAGCLMLIGSFTGLVPVAPAAAVLFAVLLLDLLVATRVSFRMMRRALLMLAVPETAILIVGAGRTGETALDDISSRADRRARVIGFIDDDRFKRGKLLKGLPVLGSLDELERIHEASKFDEIVIAAGSLGERRIAALRRFASQHQLRLYTYSVQFSELECGQKDLVVDVAPSRRRSAAAADGSEGVPEDEAVALAAGGLAGAIGRSQ